MVPVHGTQPADGIWFAAEIDYFQLHDLVGDCHAELEIRQNKFGAGRSMVVGAVERVVDSVEVHFGTTCTHHVPPGSA